MITAGKRVFDNKLNVFGNLGLGILTSPLSATTQNDVLLYGLAGIYTLNDRVNLVGEVNGFHSTRTGRRLVPKTSGKRGLALRSKRWDCGGTRRGFLVCQIARPRPAFRLGLRTTGTPSTLSSSIVSSLCPKATYQA